MAVQPAHRERHSRARETLRDLVIGMSDGLTVPFALAAGISGAVAGTHLVVAAGLAEVAAGSIAMGLGGFLAARSEAEYYARERRREELEVREKPEAEEAEVREILANYGLNQRESTRILSGLRGRPGSWVDFMMRFELGLEPPHRGRPLRSALTIGGAYAVGGLVPLAPYMLLASNFTALVASAAVTLMTLFAFGYFKGRFTGARPLRTAGETVLVGSLAAAGAYALARLVV